MFLTDVLTPVGRPYPGTDTEDGQSIADTLGEAVYDALMDDLRAIFYARPARWSSNVARFEF